MSKSRDISVHVRLTDEADAMLEMIAVARGDGATKGSVAADLLHRALLGEGHALRVAAARMVRAGLVGTNGD